MHAWDETIEDGQATAEEEDFYTSDYLEVEWILACDESKMDPKVFAQQRALNLKKALQGKKMTNFDLGKGLLGRKKSG